LASDTMIHAETVSCIAALDLDATSAVESKLFLAENLPSLPRDRGPGSFSLVEARGFPG
jgi:hypothetical protein